MIADTPDGRNINAGVGSTHIDQLVERMRGGDHTIGFAFDGDGDRVLAVDSDGRTIDGDELIAIAAVHYKRVGRLQGDGVAVTVMTNYGFHTAMQEAGIEVATTAVGDRYVNEELRKRGWRLGGEQSGHIIDLGFGPSGDGIASALLTLEALEGADPGARHAMRRLPQRLVNLRATSRDALVSAMQAALVQEAIGAAERVALRPGSGAGASLRYRAADPRDGRGAQRGGDRGGLCGPLPGGRAGARIGLSRLALVS